jgi:hypothetical protein
MEPAQEWQSENHFIPSVSAENNLCVLGLPAATSTDRLSEVTPVRRLCRNQRAPWLWDVQQNLERLPRIHDHAVYVLVVF